MVWMSAIVIEKAKSLAKSIAESEEYLELKKAKEELEKHEAALIMWRDFEKSQLELQAAIMAGEEIPDEKKKEIEKSFEIIMLNPYVRDMYAASIRFYGMIEEISRIIGEAVGFKIRPDDNLN